MGYGLGFIMKGDDTQFEVESRWYITICKAGVDFFGWVCVFRRFPHVFVPFFARPNFAFGRL